MCVCVCVRVCFLAKFIRVSSKNILGLILLLNYLLLSGKLSPIASDCKSQPLDGNPSVLPTGGEDMKARNRKA